MSRLGNQNPTQSVILPYSETLGEEAISIYEKWLYTFNGGIE